jgi:DNA-binding NtrC family response regulator
MLPSVLIVDDEQSIVQSLSGLLSDEGFEVSTAVNGYEALKVIDKSKNTIPTSRSSLLPVTERSKQQLRPPN